MARRKQARASSGASKLTTEMGASLNPLSINQPGRMPRGHYLDPTVALQEWESELAIWFKDPARVEAFGQPVRPRHNNGAGPPSV